LTLTPTATNLKDLNDTDASDVDGKLCLKYRNDRSEAVWNADKLPEWDQRVDLSANRSLGMWIDGDASGSLLLVQFRQRDYVIPIDFKGRRYIEVPHGQAAWAEGLWGWRMATWKYADYNDVHRFNIGFGKVPATTHAKINVAGIKALREIKSKLVNPVVSCGEGSIQVIGTIETGQYLEYAGGNTATVYDRNWNKVAEFRVRKKNYSIGKG
ncbi:hypothetical protein P4B35_23930, partial [Pontiellaceae bacterium B12227]|nr:hypothetical protein [Pontiellaceae bacterium B12227]